MLTHHAKKLLVAIYELTRQKPSTRTKDVAAVLGVRSPTITNKIVRLTEEGYVFHQRYGRIALTDLGHAVALETLRRNRLIEMFLVQVLGLPCEYAMEEACQLSQVLSERTIAAIEESLGHPEIGSYSTVDSATLGSVSNDGQMRRSSS